MSEFPIILKPQAIAQATTALPPVSLPPAPQPPIEPIPPERPGVAPYFLSGMLNNSVAAAIIAGSLFVLGAIIAQGAGAFGLLITGALVYLGWDALTLPERQQIHQNRVKQFPEQEAGYLRAKAELPEKRRQYEIAQATHEQNCKQLQAAAHQPEQIAAFQRARLHEILRETMPHDGINFNVQRGPAESALAGALERYFPGKIQHCLALAIEDFPYPYTTDLAYIDPDLGLHIDIEVDEPYVYKTGLPIHYVGKDRQRNNTFLERGWCIVRFSEKQVKCYPKSCCKVIAQVVAEVSANPGVLKPFANVPDLNPMPQWTESEAQAMAQRRERDRYSC